METLAPTKPVMETNVVVRPEGPSTEELQGATTEAQSIIDAPEVHGVDPSTQPVSLRKKLGRAAMARAATEVVGVGVDALLMGAGSAGVSVLANVGSREALASGVDLAVLNKLNPHEESKMPPSRIRRIGHAAIFMATAIAAQKVGPGIAEHISANLGHGFVGHFALPLTSKVGATAGMNSILKRTL